MFDKAEDLIIEFVKLKDGKHTLNFRVDETFFEELGSKEVYKADVNVQVLVDKNVNWMHCHLDIHGTLTVDCHRCLVNIPMGIESIGLLINVKGNIVNRFFRSEKITVPSSGEVKIGRAHV